MNGYKPYFLYLFLFLLISCQKNTPPVIQEITCSPETRYSGITLTFSVDAFDEDGDSLVYEWSATGGEFLDPVNQSHVRWKSPADQAGQTYTITVTAADAESSVYMDYPITLDEPVYGHVLGDAFFKGCKVAVAGLTVTIGDRSTVTDGAGHFEMRNILAGKYTVEGQHPQFHTFTQVVEIKPNVTVNLNISLTTGVLACRVFGSVKDQHDNLLSNARIVMLNPDGTESSLLATSSSSGIYHILSVPHGQRTFLVTRSQTDEFRYEKLTVDAEINQIEQLLDISMERVPLNGELIDPRDGKSYRTRLIGSKTWMADNLAYLPAVHSRTNLSISQARYYVYDFKGDSVLEAMTHENYAWYGVLYNHTAAKGACPPGWHIADKYEWDRLCIDLGLENCGYKLKTISGWAEHGGGDNSSHFNGMPGGRLQNGAFNGLLYHGTFWSVSQLTNIIMIGFDLSYSHGSLSYAYSDPDDALSIRCVKN